MMNIPPDVAAGMSLWEYEALLYHWEEAHGSGDDVGLPDPEVTMRLIEKANADPRLTN